MEIWRVRLTVVKVEVEIEAELGNFKNFVEMFSLEMGVKHLETTFAFDTTIIHLEIIVGTRGMERIGLLQVKIINTIFLLARFSCFSLRALEVVTEWWILC